MSVKIRFDLVALATALLAPTPSFPRGADDIGQGREIAPTIYM
jgi:hypothetical protein